MHDYWLPQRLFWNVFFTPQISSGSLHSKKSSKDVDSILWGKHSVAPSKIHIFEVQNFRHYYANFEKKFCVTGSPHFTRFHFARFSLYTRFIIVPNEFTLCNALHDFLTLHCQKHYMSIKVILCFTLHEFHFTLLFKKNKNSVMWGLPVIN